MKSEFYRVNIKTGEYTEKVVLDIEGDSKDNSKQAGIDNEANSEERS